MKTHLIIGSVILGVAFAAVGIVAFTEDSKPSTREQLAYQEGYSAGYRAGKTAQQDADYEDAMRQGREALAVLKKWEKPSAVSGCSQAAQACAKEPK